MNEHDYIKEAIKTLAPVRPKTLTELQVKLLHTAIGLSTEANELLDVMKKHIFYDKPIDFENLIEELGDIEWYRNVMLETLCWDPGTVRATNIRKLKKRYGESFDKAKAVNRNLEEEKKAML